MARRQFLTEAEVDEDIRQFLFCWRQQILTVMDFFFNILCTIYGYYLPTKFQVNWATQTGYNLGGGGGGGGAPGAPRPEKVQKSPAWIGLNLLYLD